MKYEYLLFQSIIPFQKQWSTLLSIRNRMVTTESNKGVHCIFV